MGEVGEGRRGEGKRAKTQSSYQWRQKNSFRVLACILYGQRNHGRNKKNSTGAVIAEFFPAAICIV